jgi:riboflavin synthase alpha subunit
LSIGQRVNLEVDSLARYAERIISMMAPSADGKRT